ncbi:MAG: rhodanese-like domain-containing protein [Firmicutes bacterium]|nr:rhodanese-like domain-containing protein [Bacillota bacterium]
MKKIIVFALAIIMILTLASCSKAYTNISNSELADMLENHPEYQFVDVRTSTEFYDTKIPGFTINLDYYIFVDDYSILDNLDKDIPVVLMCNSGNRSASAADILVKEGFKVVYNLENGIQGWDGETT